MQQVRGKIDVSTLRLVINLLRRAELDYLAPRISKKLRASAISTLFGVGESLLPKVCELFGINLSSARLILLLWKAQGKVGDPLFSFINDPDSLEKFKYGELELPKFDLLKVNDAGNNQSKPRRSKQGLKRDRLANSRVK